MKNYYRIEVKSLQNGYLVEAYYKVAYKESYDGWHSRDDQFVYTDWDQVLEFMKNNVLVVPPMDVTSIPTVASN